MEIDAATILGTPTQYPERLSESVSSLLKKWHPDVSSHPRSKEVTSHLAEMLRVVRSRGRTGDKDDDASGGLVSWLGSDGKHRRVRFRAQRSFELGEMYYGDGILAYRLDTTRSALFTRAVTTLSTMSFADQKMRDEMGRFLPSIKSSFMSSAAEPVLIMTKPGETYSLADLARSMGGSIPPVHAAWIVSGMLNVLCYLEYARIMHGDISTNTVFVCPRQHSVHLFGGWWYATGFGETVDLLPSRTFRLAPRELREEKLAGGLVDRVMVRETAFEIMRGTIPPPTMLDFLRMPPYGSALDDYKTWREHVLPESFGDARFVKLDVDARAVFGEKNG